jgi:surface protein
MCGVFWASKFNGDISNWDVSNVKDMSKMFEDNKFFNSDISRWNPKNV